jgi:hypothetical protein
VIRSQVCSFQLFLDIASAVLLGFKSHRTHEHILLSQFFRLSQPGGPDSCIHLTQELVPVQEHFLKLSTQTTQKIPLLIVVSCGYHLDCAESNIPLLHRMTITLQQPLFAKSLHSNGWCSCLLCGNCLTLGVYITICIYFYLHIFLYIICSTNILMKNI